MAPLLHLILCFVGFLATASSVLAAVDLSSVQYKVTNNALSTPGGQRFQSQVGADFSVHVMRNATTYAWKIFGQGPDERRQDVHEVLLSVDIMKGIAYTVGNAIHLGNLYLRDVPGDIRTAVTEVYFHEVTHVWQSFGAGEPTGLIEGIADYVVLKAGLGTWAKPGKGERWDQGYDATALFLDYCSSFRSTFVADLNRMMKVKYSDQYFHDLLGKTVDQLWADYKAKYGG